ncbi:zinc finger protein 354A-like [Aricia agestis]|uniref:zinc finger protein 354A-like n=1 Tax=Aricia agestis TaxID=91739 RepID=UPI001C2032C8|nr:zinc finger protein 354A-like [Aricia agestis]
MSEDGEDEIEYLDEDAEIVQQCVQTAQSGERPLPNFSIETELLVERLPHDSKSSKKKKRVEEDDFDYDPSEDLRVSRAKQRKTHHSPSDTKKNVSKSSSQVTKAKKIREQAPVGFNQRKSMDIRVPDYDDPLCLPVRAVIRDSKAWNDLCLEKFKQLDRPMRVDKEETVASKRIVELRNVRNILGKFDLAITSRTVVQNKSGNKKHDSFRSILPRYREKKILNNYKLTKQHQKQPLYFKTELILKQEANDESLVIYNPEECASFVYKMYDKEMDPKSKEEERKFYLKETDCLKMCSPCYHAKHKGYERVDPNNYCHICKRVFLNSQILVAHLRTHTPAERLLYKKKLNQELQKRVPDTYKCRICLRKFMGIAALKKHVTMHTGSATPFICEAGKHLVR